MIRLWASHPEWALGFWDEVWWSRLARPALHAWTEADQPWGLVEQSVAKGDPDPKALACYGLLVRLGRPDSPEPAAIGRRFVEGRPLSPLTTQFLEWCCGKLAAAGKRALLLVWDNAAWHLSGEVRGWIRRHNQPVKRAGQGVRVIVSPLPSKRPWLNPIEPKWVHGKRRVGEADRLLTAKELAERVCATYGCPYEEHLAIPQKAA